MNTRLAVLATVLVAFLGYSVYVSEIAGPIGFLELALREPWGMQMLLDVGISMGLFSAWLIPDARARGVMAWPWIVACFAVGSIGALAYLVSRELSSKKAPALARV
jgi:hypothetical protein